MHWNCQLIRGILEFCYWLPLFYKKIKYLFVLNYNQGEKKDLWWKSISICTNKNMSASWSLDFTLSWYEISPPAPLRIWEKISDTYTHAHTHKHTHTHTCAHTHMHKHTRSLVSFARQILLLLALRFEWERRPRTVSAPFPHFLIILTCCWEFMYLTILMVSVCVCVFLCMLAGHPSVGAPGAKPAPAAKGQSSAACGHSCVAFCVCDFVCSDPSTFCTLSVTGLHCWARLHIICG